MTFEELGIKTKPGLSRYYTICPKCNETRRRHKNVPCLTVNDEPDNRWFKCHHCNFSGNLDIMDKFNEVMAKSKMPKQLPKTYSTEVRDYMKTRGIDQSIAMREGIFEYTISGKPILGFPFYINMTLVNVKYLNIRWKEGGEGIKFWQMKREYGTKSIFLGMQSVSFERDEVMDPSKIVLITEGEWDMLTWKQCGYKNVLSVPQGAPNPKSKEFKKEFEYVDDPYVKSFFHPDNIDQIIFSTDNDEPGRFLRDHLAIFLGKERCKYINYPVGYKDINEVFAGSEKKGLKALGQAGVDECYHNLSSFPVKGIIRPSDVREELQTIAENGFTAGFGCGHSYIDRLFTLKPKHVTFVTGTPGAGKSVFIRWYLSEFVRFNKDWNFKWALFTPENRPVSREYAKLAEVMTGMSYRKGFANSMTEDMRQRTLNFIQKHFFIVSPDRKNFESWGDKIKSERVNTMDSLLEYLAYLKKTEGIFGYVIDAWNKIEHEQPKWQTETTFISQQLDYLINFNDTYDVHGIIIVHPRKIDVGTDLNYKMPSLYDIKGSSAWKEKADIGIIVHRNKLRRKKRADIPDGADEDEKYDIDQNAPTIIRTEKIRFEELGVEDRVKLTMDFKRGGRFDLYKDPRKVEGSSNDKIEPKKKDDDEDFKIGDDDTDELPF